MNAKPEPLKVIFRKDKHGDAIAFFPEISTLYGHVVCYQHIGQHGDACLEYYRETKKANEAEYQDLLAELTSIYSPEYRLVVKKRMQHDDLVYKAWKR